MDNTMLQAIWPEWQIVSCIKNDKMTSVYKVSRMHHNQEVYAAVKVISVPKEFYGSSAQKVFDLVIERIRLMESLRSTPNIVAIDDYHAAERQDGSGWDIFIRMEYLTSLAAYIETNAISEAEIIRLGQDLCSALELFRKKEDSCTLPFAHCNIKPENVFVNEYGFWKFGDFGIAKALQKQNTPTSCYIAPEILYNDYNYTADICSLGVLMYTLLNKGRIPFLRTDQKSTPEDFAQAFQKRMDGERIPPPCDASPEMANIILRACAHHLSHRFQSITEMKDALTRLDQNIYQVIPIATEKEPLTQPYTDPVVVPVRTVTPPPASAQPEPAPRSGRYSRLIVSVILTILIALMVLVIILLFKMLGFLEENSSQNAGMVTTVPAVVATESTTEAVISTETETTTTTAVTTTAAVSTTETTTMETTTETTTETSTALETTTTESVIETPSTTPPSTATITTTLKTTTTKATTATTKVTTTVKTTTTVQRTTTTSIRYGDWSAWSNETPLSGSNIEIQERTVLAGYEMIYYCIKDATYGNRVYRNYSIIDVLAEWGGSVEYGENSFMNWAGTKTYYYSADYIDSRPTVAPGEWLTYGMKGINAADITAYVVEYGPNTILTYKEKTVYETQYRYRTVYTITG